MRNRCASTYRFPEMHTYFDCHNPPDTPSESGRGWTHLHGRWHHYEDVDGDGVRFRVEWEDSDE